MALLRDWTLEKHAGIDWSDSDEVLAHRFTLHGILDAHPALRSSMPQDKVPQLSRLFLEARPESLDERRDLLRQWASSGLLQMRDARWCRRCGQQGHTKTVCQNEPPKTSAKSPLQRQRERREALALKQLDAKPSERAPPAGPSSSAEHGKASLLSHKAAEARRTQQQTGGMVVRQSSIDDQIYRGVVKILDRHRDFGELSVVGAGLVAFHFDRLLYGLKKVAVQDEVRCRIERSGDRVLAIDIRPVNPSLSRQDVAAFIADCDAGGVAPVAQMRTILDQRHEWPHFLQCLAAFEPSRRHAAVNVIIRMVTFRPNREPVHNSLLRAFLALLLSGTDEARFFPNMVRETLPADAAAAAAHVAATPTAPDMLMELGDLLVMMRTFSHCGMADVAAVVEATAPLAAACAEVPANASKLRYARSSLDSAVRPHVGVNVIPTAEQLSLPAHHPKSALHPRNLPVNVKRKYSSAEELVEAQCKLLRADTFTTASNVLAAACFELPDVTPDDQTKDDVKHARVFHSVEFLGRTCAKEQERVACFVFKMKPCEGVSLRHSLAQGQFLCFTTGLDRTKVEASELFWGIVGAYDPNLVAQGITLVYPYECDFDQLVRHLERNVNVGKPDKSMALETSIFIHGYAPVMRALSSFVGLGAAKFPMASIIVDEQKPDTESNIALIPPHFTATHRKILKSITDPLILDPGQDATMRTLRTTPVVLVQGPPGTGKSFIGSRVVESIVRFKRAVASGAALADIDVSSLKDCKPDTLAHNAGPVVVITYKNHALDEFLIDLLKSGLWCGSSRNVKSGCRCTGNYTGCCAECCIHPASMVRIGGRSQAPDLQPYNLNELMATKQSPKDVSQCRARVAILLRKAERVATEIRALERGELSAASYNVVVVPTMQEKLPHSELTEWLGGAKYIGKDTEITNPITAQFAPPLDDMLAFKAAREEVVDDKNDAEDPDDGVQLTVLAAMKAEAEFQERDTRPARNTMVSAQALRAAADGVGECPVPGVADLLSLHSLSPQQRHDLCAFWIRSATVAATKEYESIETQLGAATVLLEHARERARQEVLRDIDVIGLTTTGCAMHQDLLRSLKPSVLVVEEAAEILEAQLLACFTESLTQIVLIGDHYQLQPKVETMALERHNHMNVSLFERLVRPIEPVVLVEQRRMRPSIADLVRPFYDKDPLRDHESVALRPYIDKHGHEHTHAVPGLQRDVFLWTHTRPEEPSKVGRSMVNMLEAEMVTATVRHLIRQGVRPPSITVITPYLGQRRLLKTVLREHASKDVRISTVDRFQGDEADVIVLSLVRTKKLTQFIRMRNRMIVACSRARFAMVVIGSVELLQQSEHWSVVLKHLNEAGCVGDKLPIVDETTKDHNEVSANVPLREWLPAYAAEKK